MSYLDASIALILNNDAKIVYQLLLLLAVVNRFLKPSIMNSIKHKAQAMSLESV